MSKQKKPAQTQSTPEDVKSGHAPSNYDMAHLGVMHHSLSMIDPTACDCPSGPMLNAGLAKANNRDTSHSPHVSNHLHLIHKSLSAIAPNLAAPSPFAGASTGYNDYNSLLRDEQAEDRGAYLSASEELLNNMNLVDINSSKALALALDLGPAPDTAPEDQDYQVTPNCVKAMGEDRIAGYLIMWGNKATGDSQGNYFTKETRGIYDVFNSQGKLINLYHHGLDKNVKASPIGAIDVMRSDDIGVWVEAQLDLRNKYSRYVKYLVERGALNWSSGAVPCSVEIDRKDGRIKAWTAFEGSVTPTPAEHKMLSMPIRTLKSFYSGLETDTDLEELFTRQAALDAAPPIKSVDESKSSSVQGVEETRTVTAADDTTQHLETSPNSNSTIKSDDLLDRLLLMRLALLSEDSDSL